MDDGGRAGHDMQDLLGFHTLKLTGAIIGILDHVQTHHAELSRTCDDIPRILRGAGGDIQLDIIGIRVIFHD